MIGALLKKKREEIMKRWEERSLVEVPSAMTAATLALRDSLPLYLDHLSKALATNRKMDVRSVLIHDRESIRIGRLHGADRAGNTNYVLTEVIFEYHILREVIFQILEADGPLHFMHRDIILDSIEQAVNDAAVKFSEVHADIQQKFINTLTHDLKSPITAAKMNAQMIVRRSDQSEACITSANRIMISLSRMEAMIHDLLDTSRLRAGEKLALPLVRCDLDLVLREVVEEMRLIHGDRFIVRSNGATDGYWGSDGLRRAIENLIGNAVKYGSQETPITVSLERAKAGIKLAVHNQGNPIPAHEIPNLFQHFRRAKNVADGTSTGWGVGLTLVKGVTDAHQGKIRVESAEDTGTSFILEIPIQEMTVSEIESESA